MRIRSPRGLSIAALAIAAVPLTGACASAQSDHVWRTRLIEESLERPEPAAAAIAPEPPRTVPPAAELYFEPSSATLDETAKAALDGLAAQLAAELADETGDFYVEVRGHADGSGNEEANLRLGRARGEAVRTYLHEQGLPLERLGVVSLGSSLPAADEGTPEGKLQNRRAEVLILRR